jgi:hypothetical protein
VHVSVDNGVYEMCNRLCLHIRTFYTYTVVMKVFFLTRKLLSCIHIFFTLTLGVQINFIMRFVYSPQPFTHTAGW